MLYGNELCFFFSTPTLVILFRWSSAFVAFARLVCSRNFFFSCRSLNLGAWIWDIIMGTKSFGAFTALHSLCTMFDLWPLHSAYRGGWRRSGFSNCGMLSDLCFFVISCSGPGPWTRKFIWILCAVWSCVSASNRTQSLGTGAGLIWATFRVLLPAEGTSRERCSDGTSASLLLLFTCYRGTFASGFDTSHDSHHSIIRHLYLP